MILSSVRRTLCAVVALAGLALAGAGPGGAQSPAPVAISVTGGPTPVNTLRLAIEAAGLRLRTVRDNSSYRFISDNAQAASRKFGVKSVSLVADKSA